jgi:hypothetical protein
MHRRLALLPLVVGALCALPQTASAQGADIEAVWAFTGGQVAVKAQPDGSLIGTVIRPTTFAECAHPTGEQMWIAVVRQPDGQYFGKHQWFNNGSCTSAGRGNTAYRVLTRPDGAKFLRVCFAGPERADLQPTIAPDGSSANTTTSCSDSDLVAPLPTGRPQITTIATLPSQGRRRCLSRRSFRIRLKEPQGDALQTATVFVNNRRVGTRTGERITAPVNLRNLPRGRYTVKITAKTVLGRTITGTRRYRTCARKRAGRNRSRV